MDTIGDLEQHIQALEKANRILQKKLDRSEANRIQLEETHERQRRLLNRTIQDLERSLYELQKAQLQLVQSEKMSTLGNLIAGVAHEINNPVGFVSGNLSEVQQSFSDLRDHLNLYRTQASPSVLAAHAKQIDLEFLLEDFPQMLASMELGCDRIRSISNSLRAFARVDQDYKVPYDIHEGIDQTLLILKYRLKANETRPAIEVSTDYGDLPLVYCFPSQLKQVFMNILANSIDALDELSNELSYEDLEARQFHVKVQTSLVDQYAVVQFADNGKGIAEEVKHQIFDYLFTTKEIGKGTGMGLAIAHQIIVEKHEGLLEVNSELGKGAEFVIRLPVLENPETFDMLG